MVIWYVMILVADLVSSCGGYVRSIKYKYRVPKTRCSVGRRLRQAGPRLGAGVVVDSRQVCVCVLELYTNTIGRRGRSRGSKSRRQQSAYHTTPLPPSYLVQPGVTITVAGDLLPHGCCCCCPPIHRDPLHSLGGARDHRGAVLTQCTGRGLFTLPPCQGPHFRFPNTAWPPTPRFHRSPRSNVGASRYPQNLRGNPFQAVSCNTHLIRVRQSPYTSTLIGLKNSTPSPPRILSSL